MGSENDDCNTDSIDLLSELAWSTEGPTLSITVDSVRDLCCHGLCVDCDETARRPIETVSDHVRSGSGKHETYQAEASDS